MPKKRLRLIVIRHAKTEKNSLRIVQGQGDSELSHAGLNDIRDLSDTIQNETISAVYSSDLRRAMTTASILVEGRQIPVISEPRLREQAYGIFEGGKLFPMLRNMKQVGADFTCFNPPEGEKAEAFRQRIKQFLDEITDEHIGDSVMLVTHHGVIKMLIEGILRLKLDPLLKNTYYSNGTAIIVYIGPDGSASIDRVIQAGNRKSE